MRILTSLAAAVIVMTAVAAHAQDHSRGWVDVSFIGATPQQEEQSYSWLQTQGIILVNLMSAYPELPKAKGLDIGAGYQFHRMFGVGVQFDRTKYTYTAGLGVDRADIFGGTDFDSGSTEELERSDSAINIMATFIAPTPDAWRIRIFGGPSYFSVKQDSVSDISYLTGNGNIVGYDFEEIDGSGWGFNVGADVAYFFTRHVGIGGVLRFNKGSVEVTDPLSEVDVELDAGHTVYGGGLRLRF